MRERDNIHFNFRTIDGYDLSFNFAISEREPGKTTALWLDKGYKVFKEKGQPSIVIRRKHVHITDAYIHDIFKIINEFTDDAVSPEYKSSAINNGVVDVNIKGKLFIRIISLSADISAVKSGVILNPAYFIFDEFICNPKFGEKYVKDEATKFMEIYNTYRRENANIKCYFCGNPYSLYNPYFMFFDVDTTKLKRGAIVTNRANKYPYVIQCYEMLPELRAKILAENPLYQFENSYTNYAFNGINVNDQNIRLMNECPTNFRMQFVFKIQGRFIAVYQTNNPNDNLWYWCSFIKFGDFSRRRDVIAFDFEELVDQTMILSPDERYKFSRFRNSMRKRLVAFSSIEVYYLTEEVYYNL